MMEEKKCSCCGKTKCVLEFNFNARSKDGLTSQCKQCIKEKALKRGQYTAMLRRMAKKEQHDQTNE